MEESQVDKGAGMRWGKGCRDALGKGLQGCVGERGGRVCRGCCSPHLGATKRQVEQRRLVCVQRRQVAH
eukprot:356701-Chlamydomonas_euryale.AAC.3